VGCRNYLPNSDLKFTIAEFKSLNLFIYAAACPVPAPPVGEHGMPMSENPKSQGQLMIVNGGHMINYVSRGYDSKEISEVAFECINLQNQKMIHVSNMCIGYPNEIALPLFLQENPKFIVADQISLGE
jgi:hypothetical protein